MDFILESKDLADYLMPIDTLIDFNHPLVRAKILEIEGKAITLEERARLAFEIARDDIQHSFDDHPTDEIAICASDTLASCEGICFAKAHLLAALLRGMGIPTGFCYQRVMKKDTPASGFALHGLNAIYLSHEKGWFRVDPRGNNAKVKTTFNMEQEDLAYSIRPGLGEIDYPTIYVRPLPSVVKAMEQSPNSEALFDNRPENI